MPGPDHGGRWFDTEDEAWEYIDNMTCGFGTGELCEMCQAEWAVFTREEMSEILGGAE